MSEKLASISPIDAFSCAVASFFGGGSSTITMVFFIHPASATPVKIVMEIENNFTNQLLKSVPLQPPPPCRFIKHRPCQSVNRGVYKVLTRARPKKACRAGSPFLETL